MLSGVACYENWIGQKFTRVARPKTNGKAERVIRTLMEMWHEKQSFDRSGTSTKGVVSICELFIHTVKPHGSLGGDTPFEGLAGFILNLWCKQREDFLHVNHCRITY